MLNALYIKIWFTVAIFALYNTLLCSDTDTSKPYIELITYKSINANPIVGSYPVYT